MANNEPVDTGIRSSARLNIYVPDVFIQFSGFRSSRARWRLVLLIVGFAFAAMLTHFVSEGAFSGSSL